MQCLEDLEGKSKYDEYRGIDYRSGEKERWDERRYPSRYY